MTKRMIKAFIIPPQFSRNRIGGQMPNVAQESRRLIAMMGKHPPKTVTAEMMFTTPTMRVEKIVDGLGFNQQQEQVWSAWLNDMLHNSTNELTMRKALFEKMQESRLPHEKRQVMFQRSLGYFKDRIRKSVVEIVTPDELLKAHKDRMPGGLADKKKPSDFDPEALRAGIKVEMEHTNDRTTAREIAMDHLAEDPAYYRKLKTIEKSLEKATGPKGGEYDVVGGKKVYRKKGVKRKKGSRKDVRTGGTKPPPSEGEQRAKLAMQEGQKRTQVFRQIEEKFGISRRDWFKLSPDEQSKVLDKLSSGEKSLEKADPKGGKYFKRTSYTSKSGKPRHRYFYDEDSYKKSKGAHVSGEDAERSYIDKCVTKAVEAGGKDGCSLKSLQPLVKKYGAKKVGAMLKERTSGGQLQYKRGKLYKGTNNG